jgi:hypothetical protein
MKLLGTLLWLCCAGLFFSCGQSNGEPEPDAVTGASEIPEETESETEIAPKVIGIEVNTMPDTTYYALNEPFDMSGFTLNILYENGGTKPYTGAYTLIKEPPTNYGGEFPTFNVSAVIDGDTYTLNDPLPRIAVSYDTKKLIGMTMNSPPAKLSYYLGEKIDLSGLKVSAKFRDTQTNEETTQSNFNINAAETHGYDRFKRGQQTVTVRVNNAGFPITVNVAVPPLAAGKMWVNYHYTNINNRQNEYIKPVYIKGKDFDFARSNIKVTLQLDGVQLTLSPGNGLLPGDVKGFNKNAAGVQKLSIALENNMSGGPSFLVYVVELEPDVWFDYGYVRHAGDPTGHGPGAGKYYARPGEKLVLAPVRYLIGFDDDPAISNMMSGRDAGAQYSWSVVSGGSGYTLTPSAANVSNSDRSDDWAGASCAFTPNAAGTYRVKLTVTGKSYITGNTISKTAETDVVCFTEQLSKQKFTSPLRNFAPGQFTESGNGYGWSLGAVGGYIAWSVDHQASYYISGNPFSYWNEAGIVWFQEDRNGNGIPDETWYEALGYDDVNSAGDYANKKLITRRYAITYINLSGMDELEENEYGQTIRGIGWVDCKGRTGVMGGGWPKNWGITGTWATYTGTLLRDNGLIAGDVYTDLGGVRGYVDTGGVGSGSKYTGYTFHVSDAAYADGAPANLSAVRFIKVQTAMFRYGGIFGDVSTEINNADGLGILTNFPKP